MRRGEVEPELCVSESVLRCVPRELELSSTPLALVGATTSAGAARGAVGRGATLKEPLRGGRGLLEASELARDSISIGTVLAECVA